MQTSPVSRRAHLIGMILTASLVAGACGGSNDSAEQREASDLEGAFGDDTVSVAVDLLAGAGVTVRVRPDEDPLAAVDDPGPLALLRFQARNLALEANRAGGTLGADLDALTEGAGGAPISYLIAGWARGGATPSATVAAELLGIDDSTNPPDLVIPGLVVAMFLGDLTSGGTDRDRPVPSGWRKPPARPAGDEPTDDFCADVSAYLSASLEDTLDTGRELEPQWLQAAIDLYAPWETNPERIRTAVGTVALMVYATSISRPWVPLLVANPLGEVHYRVGSDATPFDPAADPNAGPLVEDDEILGANELRLSVDVGEGSFADEAAECAALADIGLTEHEVEGTDIGWLVAGLLPHATDPQGDLELDEDGHAAYEWKPVGEDDERHRNGILNTAVVPVAAFVVREEVKEVSDLIKSLLIGGDFGVAAPAVQATYARVAPMLDQLLYPRASTAVTITWHTPNPPEDELGECGEGCAASNGDPHLVPVSGNDYDFQAAGEYTLLRSTDGAMEIQARQQPAAGSTTVATTTAVATRIGDQRLGIYRSDAGVELLLDGSAIALTEPAALGGGSVAPYSGGVEVTFPDGTVMWVIAAGPGRLDVVISPSDEVRDAGAGLLGPAADEGYGLPLLPDGSVVAEPGDEGEAFDLLYGEFGPAWRVTATSSLFDYASGESSETFVVEDFPSRPLTYDDLTADQLAVGEQACAEVPIAMLHRQCVFDVAVTGDPSFAETYLMIGRVIAEAGAGLGEPGPIIGAAPAGDVSPPPSLEPVSSEVIESRPTTTASVAVAEPRAGEPTITLAGLLAASYSDQAFDDGVVAELRGRMRAEEGAVVLLHTDDCPPDATVFVSVTHVGSGVSASPFLCDPRALRTYMVDDDDELIDGEVYVWVPAAGELEIYVDTDAEIPAPMTIDVYTDPTPAVVAGDELLAEGHATTLSGIGDTVVYDLDGSAPTLNPAFVATGLDAVCGVEVYGTDPLGTPEPWDLGVCDHGSAIGAGLAGGGAPVPIVVFSRTDEETAIELTPGA